MGVFKKYRDRSFWRKIAMASWRHPRDPHIYGALEIDARAMVKVLDEVREAGGPRVTPAHFVGKGVGEAIPAFPAFNGIIVRGRVRTRATIDVWFNVAFGGGDLFGAKVTEVDRKSVPEISAELAAGAEAIRRKKEAERDKRLRRYDRLTKVVPVLLLRPFLWLIDLFNFRLGINLTWAGVERDPFGTVMVTNVGTFGIKEQVFAPIPPLMRLPAVILVGMVHEKAVVEDGRVVARPILPLGVSVDHRYVDGFQAVRLFEAFRGYLEDEGRLRASLSPTVGAERDAT